MLVDLQTTKQWLEVDSDYSDLLVDLLARQAEVIVLKHIKREDHTWTKDTVPLNIQAAILHVMKRIHDDRAGELEGGPLGPHVRAILEGERAPTIA